jgi:hypothetical protein
MSTTHQTARATVAATFALALSVGAATTPAQAAPNLNITNHLRRLPFAGQMDKDNITMSKNVIKARTRGRVAAATMLAASAIAVGALCQAPAANAQPISQNTIQRECGQAGGSYQWWGSGTSTCTYTDIGGDTYRDYYINGVYTRTD